MQIFVNHQEVKKVSQLGNATLVSILGGLQVTSNSLDDEWKKYVRCFLHPINFPKGLAFIGPRSRHLY